MFKSTLASGLGIALLCANFSANAAAIGNNASIEGIIAGTYQTASESHVNGDRVHNEGNAQLYLFGTLDMGVGAWNMEIRAGTSPRNQGVSSFYDSNALVGETVDSDGDGRVAITQFFYELPVGPNDHARAGLLDPAALLDSNAIANDEYTQFLADAFVNNSTISMPSFVLGAAYQGTLTPSLDYTLFVGSDSGLEDGDHRYHNVFDVSGDRDGHSKGAFTTAELGWHSNGYMLKGGFWYDTGRVDELDASGASHGYGVYALAGAPLGTGRVQMRAGIANDEAQEAANFLSVAYQHPIQLPDRDTTLGLAIARTGASDQLIDADPIYQAEVYWRINVTHSLYVSPDVQYIRHTGFDASADDAFVAGIRVGLAFPG